MKSSVKNNNSKITRIIVLTVGVLILISVSYLVFLKLNNSSYRKITNNFGYYISPAKNCPAEFFGPNIISEDIPNAWLNKCLTYKDKDKQIEITLPYYMSWKDSSGYYHPPLINIHPSPDIYLDCQGKDEIQNQIYLLKSIDKFPKCQLSKDFSDSFLKNFRFNSVMPKNLYVEGLKLNSGKCAVMYLQLSGYVLALEGFHYTGIAVNNNKVVEVSFPLFSSNFKSTNSILKSLRDSSGVYNGSKVTNYSNNLIESKFELASFPAQDVIKLYNSVFATLKFTNK